ncbi:unnamed protein product [Choristocarpus tenellus]
MFAFGPESFTTLQRAVKEELSNPSLKCIIRLLRLSHLDPDIFMKFRSSLVQQVSSRDLAPSTRTDLRNDAEGVARQWYQLQQGKDVSFEVARLMMALKDFGAALHLFQQSSRRAHDDDRLPHRLFVFVGCSIYIYIL